ncbi:hypothetical protein QU41_00785 [Bradyrhizobium elkanii]|nr:hypothetical protein QU41_00785 [Bradyrhizobium elkanii]
MARRHSRTEPEFAARFERTSRAWRGDGGWQGRIFPASPTRPGPCRLFLRVCCGLRPRRSASRPSRKRPVAADLAKVRPRPAQGSSRLEPRLSATGSRSPGGPRTLKRPSSRRRWATAPEGRAGRGRIEPDGETLERTSP